MAPYLIIYIISIAFFSVYKYSAHSVKDTIVNFFILSGACLPLILLGGLRALPVGTDTFTYSYMYLAIPANLITFIESSNLGIFDEPLFKIFQFFFRFPGLNFNYFLSAISAFITLTYIGAIKQQQRYNTLSLIIFLLLGFYTFHFNGARQAIAVAIFFYSLKYILNGNKYKFYCFIFIGFMFHKSIIICLPALYLVKGDLNTKKIIIVALLTLFFASFLDVVVNFASSNIDSRYSGFALQKDSAMGVFYNLVNFVIFIILYGVKLIYNIQDRTFNTCLSLSFVGVLLGVVSVLLKLDPNGIARASIYFNQFFIYLIPIAIYSINSLIWRSVALIFVLFLCLIYFISTTYKLANLYPYLLV